MGDFKLTLPLNEEQNKQRVRWIDKITNDTEITKLIVTDINNGDFDEFINNNPALKEKYKKPLYELPISSFKFVIKQYKLYTYPTPSDFSKTSTGQAKGLFTSSAARNTALLETSRLLGESYYNLAFVKNVTKLKDVDSGTQIINSVKQKAVDNLLVRFSTFARANQEENKDFNKIVEDFDKINKLNDRNTVLLIFNKSYQNKKITNTEAEQLLKNKEEYNANKIAINDIKKLLIQKALVAFADNTSVTSKDVNYAAMVSNMLGQKTSKNWFYEVYNMPETFAIRKAFDKIFKDTESEASKVFDDPEDFDTFEGVTDEELLAFDQNTGTWDDALYNNYIKHFDGKLLVYLNSRLYKLYAPTPGAYETSDNLLGVPERMGVGFTISQLLTFGDFSSIDNFISSIENVANKRASLAGLIVLVQDMKKDPSFANQVYSNFYKYPIKKSIISYSNNNANVYHSNKNAFAGAFIFQKAFSAAKITSQTENLAADKNTIKSFINQLGSIDEKHFIKTKENIAQFIGQAFKQYFPGVDYSALSDWYWENGGNKEKAITILNLFSEFITASETLKKEILDKKLEVSNYNKFLKKKLAELDENPERGQTIYDNLKPAQVDYSAFNYSKLEETTKNIIRLFEKYLPSYTEYNSANAENNTSSDLIKNSFITNFIKQLNDVETNPDGSVTERGLEKIKDFYTRKGDEKETLQHQYSTILFGIPGVRDGLFIERNGKYFISENARKLIDLSLFNGIKNFDTSSGEMYQKMTSLDYYNTLVHYYFNPVNYNNNNPDYKDFCQILLRIPSDASNQYVLQMKKYNASDLYSYNKDAVDNYATDKLYQPYTSVKGYLKDDTDRISKDLNPLIVKAQLGDRKNNIITATDVIDILSKGIINIDGYYNYNFITKNNKVIVPLVYLEKGESFIIYCEADNTKYKEIRSAKPISIQSLERINIQPEEGFSMESLFGDEDIVYNPIGNVFKKFVTSHFNQIASNAFINGAVERNYNVNNELFKAFAQNVKGEINNFFNALTDLIEVENKDGVVRYLIKEKTDGLFNNYHYKKTIVNKDSKKLTGSIFKFKKLFDIYNYSASSELMNALNIYGGLLKETEDGRLEVAQDYSLYNPITKHISNLDEIQELNNIISTWLNKYSTYILNNINNYILFGSTINNEQLQEMFLNTTIAYYEMDDLFEGDSSYYKDAQTFLKRDKEIQAGGSVYGGSIDFTEGIGTQLHDFTTKEGITKEVKIIDSSGKEINVKANNFVNGEIKEGSLTVRNGFRAVVIQNVVNVSDVAEDIFAKIYKNLSKEGLSNEDAKVIAENIAKGYGYGDKNKRKESTYDDAQSYITIEEFIRRKYLDGTISEYGDLLSKLLDENYKFTKEDYDNIKHKVQVQKNFYYDIAFDKKTGLHYPRQIKNAEFVLIPRFIKGTSLETLYKTMIKYDINQVNTIETSKAANINVSKFWDNDGKVINIEKEEESLNALENDITINPNTIQTYYYNYLYKQQDFVDHIEDEVNKAGIQVIKKILDNISDKNTDLVNAKNTIQNNLSKNIQASFEKLLKDYGWELDENGKIPEGLDFSKFFEDARRESSRLGMDRNFVEYLTPDASGHSVYPLVMNDKAYKLESIAQSIFNHHIIRQTLPGFHAVQVSDVGFDSKLKYIPRKENENVGNVDSYVEIKVAPWSEDIINLLTEFGEEETLRLLNKIGADEIIGYRIPTEGKQSIAKMKVVGFLNPAQGSTMVVAKEWVTQSGSDFDIDTIYTITYKTHLQKHDDGSVELVKDGNRTINKENNNEENIEKFNIEQDIIRRNNEILDAFKTIISSDDSFEENMSRSNSDDIDLAMKRYNTQFKNISVYDPFTQIQFMQNAIDGRKLKARSVNRDTFNSISNVIHGMLKDGIYVEYDLNEYSLDNIIAAYGRDNIIVNEENNTIKVYHNKIGWSKNNRNVVGKLITPYSSETTAHILDAIKNGTIFNETDYTFGAFKTLIDVGIDYNTAISFLAQETITDLNNIYNEYNSIFSNTKNDVIATAYRNFINTFKITTPDLVVNNYTSIKAIYKSLDNNKDFVKRFYEYWGIKPSKNNEGVFTYTFNYKDNNIIPAFNKSKFEKALNDYVQNTESYQYHYLGVLMMFEKLEKQGNAIENLVKVSRPDASGVKQTIFNTVRFVDNVNKELRKTDEETNIITEDGNSFIKALYVDKKYPYLAADYYYGILPSIEINRQLFITSNKNFYNGFKLLEDSIDRKLDESNYKQFTQYAMSSIYRSLSDIVSPIKLDNNGNIQHITGDPKLAPNYWDEEIGRIYGFNEPENGDNFTVSDFVNPKPEELEQYYKLTPLQKIVFLQKQFAGRDTIFSKFFVSKTSNRVEADKAYSYNTISINSDSDNIDGLYNNFDEIFFSENLYVRAAAIDLVKYAFIVEGYGFRKGNVAKIIPNDVLYNARNYGGFDLAPEINPRTINFTIDTDFIESFVRSHSNLIKEVYVEKPTNDIKNQNTGDVINSFREVITVKDNNNNERKEYSGLIRIPLISDDSGNGTEGIYRKLNLSTNANKAQLKYIKLREFDDNKNKFVVNLYEAVPRKDTLVINGKATSTIKEYILTPLNLLEEFEHGELSVNADNITHYIKDFYITRNTDLVYTVDDISPFIAQTYKKQIQGLDKIDILDEVLAENPSPKRNIVVKMQEQLMNWLEDRNTLNTPDFGLIQVANFSKELVGAVWDEKTKNYIASKRRLTIDQDGTSVVFELSPYDNELQLRKQRKEYLEGKIKLTPYLEKFVKDPSIYWSNNDIERSLYTVKLYTEQKVNIEEQEQTLDNDNIQEENLSAFSGVFDSWTKKEESDEEVLENATNEDKIFNVSNLIMKELQYNSYQGNESIKKEMTLLSIKGFIFGDEKSLHDYQKNIYEIAAKFYKDKSRELLDKMHHFVVADGVYNISDEALYKKLKDEPKKAFELYRLLLEASNFGKKLPGIDKIIINGDSETLKNIKSIQNSINAVITDEGLKAAFDFVYNIYLAENFSSNPNIQMEIIKMTDIFGDSDFFDTNIGDVTNLNHKQVQIVTKIALRELQKAKIDAIEETAAFTKKWNEIQNILGEAGMKNTLNKIIDENGKFIQKYTNDFLTKKQEYDDKVHNAIKEHGIYSVEHIRAKQEQRKWYLDNVVQPYTKEYYEDVITSVDYMFNRYPEYLSEYLKLENEYHNFGPYALLTKEEKDRRNAIQVKMAKMMDTDGKTGEDAEKADALGEYNNDMHRIKGKYFDRIVSDEFIARIKANRDIVDAYMKKAYPRTMYDLYMDPDSKYDDFREAYDWLKYNTRRLIDKNSREKIQEAFKKLGTTDDINKREIWEIIHKIPDDELYDISGQMIGTRFTLEQCKKIKELSLEKFLDKFVVKDYVVTGENSDKYNIDGSLIKVVDKGPVLNERFYKDFFNSNYEESAEDVNLRNNTYTKINNIISKALTSTGKVSARLLAKNCTKEELEELTDCYNVLKSLDSMRKATSTNFEEGKEKPYTYITNEAAVLEQGIELEGITGELKFLIERIIYQTDDDGITLVTDDNGLYVGNRYLYGFIKLDTDKDGNYTPEAKKYIDEEKTNARTLLDDNVEYVETEYYWKALDEASKNGTLEEWKEANHYYDPYKHKTVPIRIWTTMTINPNGSLGGSMEDVASYRNTEARIKDTYKNPEYKDKLDVENNSSYYNSTYNTLNEQEQNLRALLLEYAQKYAIADFQKQFLKENYAPRLISRESTWTESINDALNTMGLGLRNTANYDWHNNIGFINDFDAKFNMYSLIKTRGVKPIPKKPSRTGEIDDAAYEKKLQQWEKDVKEVKEYNKELDKKVFSKDWFEVYKELIKQGSEYVAKDKVKDLLYMTLQDIRERDAYDVGYRRGLRGNLIKEHKSSTNDTDDFRKTSQKNTAAVFENWVRRFLFDEYKDYDWLRGFADRIQSATSSRFMMGNALSGVNNVAVGLVNMRSEMFAQDYFNGDQFRKAVGQYLSGVKGYVNNFFTGEVNNEQEAIFELFNIDTYDRVNNTYKDYKTLVVEKANDIAYGFLSMGEHYMQHSAVLAMLESHRIYENPLTHKKEVGTLYNYMQNIEFAALNVALDQMASNSGTDAAFVRDLKNYFKNTYLPSVKKDNRKKLRFDRMQIDVVNDFIRSDKFNMSENPATNTARKKAFIEYYTKVKKDLMVKAEKDFNQLPTVKSAIEYDSNEHREKIKAGSGLTVEHIADITQKAISVNKKIHGVYDKLGAAKIETLSLGSLFMQYRKHLYPGFTKFWRLKGFWSEFRQNNEYGVFQSMINLLSMDNVYGNGINNKFNIKEVNEDDSRAKQVLVELVNNIKLAINSAIDIKYNWALLPDWQKRNIKRVLGYLAGYAKSLALILAIYGLVDDDDIKKSNWWGSLIFLADRLNNESKQFNPRGIYSEFENFRQTPVVGYKILQDFFKVMGYVMDAVMLGDEYNPNYQRGTYKDENKIWVTFRKNMPIYNQWVRLQHISKNNNFYKVGENSTDQTIFKNIGKAIHNDKESRDDANAYGFIR